MLGAIVAAGIHGLLNARLRAELSVVLKVSRWKIVDGAPRVVWHRRRTPRRLLADSHDIDAFATEATAGARRIVREVAAGV